MLYEVRLICEGDVKKSLLRLADVSRDDEIKAYIKNTKCSANWAGILPLLVVDNQLKGAMLSSYAANMFIKSIQGIENGVLLDIVGEDAYMKVPDFISELVTFSDISDCQIKELKEPDADYLFLFANGLYKVVHAESKEEAERKFRSVMKVDAYCIGVLSRYFGSSLDILD